MPLPALSADDLLRHLADVHTEAELRARLSELSDPENTRSPGLPAGDTSE
ncbi:MAG: hypothetical protein JNK30_12565 [Phenylobacterium sp.]|nr:hypothetical protein [Phenylobacterium sp.]MBL8772206.1 hypothetical protein [Phenylobacterium sp.]